MHDRVSKWASDLLAHKSGLVAFNLFTAVWFMLGLLVPEEVMPGHVVGGLLVFVAVYLDIVTWFGGATQFTLAYENRKATEATLAQDAKVEAALDLVEQAVANQIDTMKFFLEGQKTLEARIDEVLSEVRLHHPTP